MMNTNLEEQEDELLALQSIFDPDEFSRHESKFSGEIRVSVELPADFSVALKEGESVRQYEISFLPPLLLTFDLPEDYPSSSPPSFSLTCSWLTHTQLTALSDQLLDLYSATGGAVVLFSWVQFLREDALKFLDVHSVLELQEGGGSLLSQMLVLDAAGRRRAFDSSLFDCGVCFLGCRGSDCLQLLDCGHVFCRECLSHFCRLQITEGNVRGVSCPQADCSASPTPEQVKALVGEELFSRYDRLLLQSSLDAMSDVTYCPRRSCGAAVLLEASGSSAPLKASGSSAPLKVSSSPALCSACGFAFCVSCRKTFHGENQCHDKKKSPGQVEESPPHAALPESQEGLKALWDDYQSGSKPRRRLLEGRYGRAALLTSLVSELNEDWIVHNSKPCPHCSCQIQKNGGCSVMTCSQCRQVFCWVCLGRIYNISQHFENNSCPRFQV